MDDVAAALIAGRYALAEPIGSGASSRVFRAHDALLDRDVALKMLHPGDDELARARLRDEARIVSNLRHPGIAQVFDYGEAEVGGEVQAYLALQLVEGRTLREVLREVRLSPDSVWTLIAQVADALAHAHAAGVVHRDVKPGNIMLTPAGDAVLLDFGIARRTDFEPLTLTGTIVGTVDYLSSEQANGQSATPRSDLYALGCVAYEALTGVRPFQRATMAETLAAHAHCEAAPLPRELPPALRALIEQMIRRDPSQRPADAATVARVARHRDLIASGTARRRRAAAVAFAGLAAAVAVMFAITEMDPDGTQSAAATGSPTVTRTLATSSTPSPTAAAAGFVVSSPESDPHPRAHRRHARPRARVAGSPHKHPAAHRHAKPPAPRHAPGKHAPQHHPKPHAKRPHR